MSAEATVSDAVIPATQGAARDGHALKSEESGNPVFFARYPKYKDSGVEWLGDVPAHWEVTSCRSFVEEQTAKNEGAKDQNYLSLMANVGVLPYEEKGDVGNKKPEDLTKCKLVSRGDFVINSMNYGIGSYGVSPYDGVCSPVYIVLRPRLDRIEPRFAFRLFENRAFQTYAQSFGNGILEHRAAINWDILKGIGAAIPPRAEQVAILDFLDREIAKIDALIAEQEKLIALLKEKRQALISHAVTKGLDPNAPMKDSGIEWLGQVPMHWELKPLKYLATFRSGGTPSKENPGFWNGSVPWASAKDLKVEVLYDAEDRITEYAVTSGAANVIPAGSVVVVVRGMILARTFPVALLGSSIAINQDLKAILASGAIHPGFLAWYLRGTERESLNRLDEAGHGTKALRMDSWTSLIVALPPVGEQSEIAGAVEAQAQKIDALTTEAEHAIALLQERRTALISAAATGKIDVRSA